VRSERILAKARQERLARNARAATAGQLTLKLFGIPEGFATWLGLTGE